MAEQNKTTQYAQLQTQQSVKTCTLDQQRTCQTRKTIRGAAKCRRHLMCVNSFLENTQKKRHNAGGHNTKTNSASTTRRRTDSGLSSQLQTMHRTGVISPSTTWRLLIGDSKTCLPPHMSHKKSVIYPSTAWRPLIGDSKGCLPTHTSRRPRKRITTQHYLARSNMGSGW